MWFTILRHFVASLIGKTTPRKSLAQSLHPENMELHSFVFALHAPTPKHLKMEFYAFLVAQQARVQCDSKQHSKP